MLGLATDGLGAGVPLPRPRPDTLGEAATQPPEVPTAPAEPSACRKRLTPDLAHIEPLAPVKGPGECGGDDLVRLDAIVVRGRARVAVQPPATLRCEMAEAITHWVRDEVAPAVAELGPLREIANFASFECRGRNRVIGAKLSEHGKANALDIRAFILGNGRTIEPTDAAVSRPVRERLKHGACARFHTVLGPGSDGYHENHIHVDLLERRSGYRMCQWAVRDPADVAVPLPRERPPEAPPRSAGMLTPPR